jgi:stage III sporulation protein AH
MNTKRQTIWLVSMLSLMVILSAYYLFTDNVDELETTSGMEDTEQMVTMDEVSVGENLTDEQLSMGSWEDIEVAMDNDEADPMDTKSEQIASKSDQITSKSDQISVSSDQAKAVKPDKEVIEHVQAGAKSGEEYFSALLIKRNEALANDTERLLGITVDPEKSDAELVKAQEQLDAIEDMQYKISDLEDQLMQDYENVVITEEKGKWKAVVQADKIERSQAVSIMDLMIQNLGITPNKIAGVQFVQ